MTVSFTQLSTLQKSGLIASFDGDVGGYVNFRDQFIMTVHGVNMSILAKFMLLRSALSTVSELKPLLGTVPVGKRGYALLIQRLEDKYGGKDRSLSHHLAQLKKASLVRPGDLQGAENLYDLVNSYQAALAQAGSKDPHTHSYYSFVKGKLSHEMRLKYVDYCALKGIKNPQKMSHLLHWLHYSVICPLRLEPAPAKKPGGVPPAQGKVPSSAYRAPEMQPEGQKKLQKLDQQGGRLFAAKTTECVMCGGSHVLPQCKKFLDLSPTERRESVSRLRVCFRCLLVGHVSANCSAECCSVCKKPHHTLTHAHTREFLNNQKSGGAQSNSRAGQPSTNGGAASAGETIAYFLLKRSLDCRKPSGKLSLHCQLIGSPGTPPR